MSSLHHDGLLDEGPVPTDRVPVTLAPARGTSRRPVEDRAASTVPTQRQGKSQRTGTTTTTAPRTAAPAAGGATAEHAVADPAAAAPAAEPVAAPPPATVAETPAVVEPVIVIRRTGGGKHAAPRKGAAGAPSPLARAATAAKPAGKPRHASPGRSTSATRPDPRVRTRLVLSSTPSQVEPATVTEVGSTDAAPLDAAAVVAAVAEGRLARFLGRAPSVSRRPGLYLAAALVGAFAVGAVTTDGTPAQATDTMSTSVSVAEELGIHAKPIDAISPTVAVERLGALTASRNLRDAEQAAAAQVQADADREAVAAAAEAARPRAVHPVEGARLTSTYGARWGTLHAGIDLAAPMRTPEKAVMDGIVLEAGPASGFGLAVYIQHENGDVTVYGHMDSILVQAGQVVRAGDTIALLGNRGQSTGPHLHFEVHIGGLNGQKVDPLPWLRERGIAI
ncbi:MAG TPA: M23 family metallopeptidase [Blastococcus sp.]|jgi:murein DD-endopeptidase MepM/ murein hydrolase activator NlpD